jgi:hypothetical protein
MLAIILAAYGGLTVGAPLGYLLRVKIERAPRRGVERARRWQRTFRSSVISAERLDKTGRRDHR